MPVAPDLGVDTGGSWEILDKQPTQALAWRGQRMTSETWFSPSTMWVWGIEPRSSGSQESALIH